MSTGIILVGMGALLVLVPLLLAYRTVPGLKAQASGIDLELNGQASRDLPRTPAAVRNVIVGVLVLIGLSTAGVGLKLVIDAAAVSNAERLANLRADNKSQLQNLAKIVSTPLSARTPVPGRTPIPAAPPQAGQLFTAATKADEAGDSDRAIALYTQAISAGLPQPYLAGAQLEIALLDLEAIEGLGSGNVREKTARCDRASLELQSVLQSPTDKQTRDTATSAVEQLKRLCSSASV